jgi:hypothetical protein
MTFWLLSGWFQKSGAAMRLSVCASFCFCAGASKIPPHGERLLAERLVFAELFFDCHEIIPILTNRVSATKNGNAAPKK